MLILSICINQMPLLMSSWLMDMSTVAAFQVALKLSSIVAIVITAVNTVTAPLFAAYNINNQNCELKRLYINSTFFVVTFTIPVIICLFSFSTFFMGIFGELYKEYHTLLQILLIGQVCNVLTGPLACLLTMTGKYSIVIYSNVLNVIVILLGYVLSIFFESYEIFLFSISIGMVVSNLFMFRSVFGNLFIPESVK
nr:MATE family efflux transporter [Shewanella sp. N2AIL]